MDKIPLSVVTIARNEERNISDCLGSTAGWADEHIVVDDFSSDRTVEIARSNGAVLFQRKMDVEGIHRNWAYQKARNHWVLSLDADETVTDELKEEISRAIKSDEYVVYNIPLRTYIGDYWVRHGGWYPGGKDRLFRKSKFRYEEVGVHPRVIYDGKCGRLTGDIIHKGYEDFSELFRGLDAQTTREAEKWFNEKRKIGVFKMLWKAGDRFFRAYSRKQGYKDGIVGFVVAMNGALYQVFSYAKYWEMRNAENKKKIIFLDRDGVINKDPGFGDYVKSWREFKFLPGAIDAIRLLNKNGYDIHVISNQAGVAKGLFTQEDLDEITGNMLEEIEARGGEIKSVSYCVHAADAGCDCRKPKTGLIKKAVEGLDADFKKIYFIGDSRLDVGAGRNAGCKTVLLLTGKERPEDIGKFEHRPDFIKNNLLEAVRWVLREG
ncbi:MAG: HAD-IIIA family hydrolase [Candidatus Omnitrophota bacterium]